MNINLQFKLLSHKISFKAITQTGLVLLVCCSPLRSQYYFEDFVEDKEVMIFLKENFDGFKNFTLGIKCKEEEHQWYLDSMEFIPWYVGDFNQDEIPDLFITGQQRKEQEHYLILGKEETDQESPWQIFPVRPPKVRGDFVVPMIEETRKNLYIVLRQFKTKTTTVIRDGLEVRLPRVYNDYYKLGLMKKDTLVYKYGSVIEFNPKPETEIISYVQMHAFCQFGGCPDYKVKISQDGQMILHNIQNTNEDIGLYSGTCEPVLLDQIFELANYIKLKKKLEYFGDSSADKTVTMIISYDEDNYYSWYDYEQGASLGISRLYELVIAAKENAGWEPAP